ncbi:hydantoinase B/oxoprolinase family protein [Haematobacter genomosp. 1]|uniref:Hydantoinase n=1 Tax=Haematobacter genomosp. 1 TaxID=366618 RepID=A0A212ABE9_9RHOB|nr:hydantoinase B/oxoprolinase family protein [Haematobacter genomosp. 1]OWJ77919.1 hydantoinase [Haematobacter genomosp. 1]
MLMQTPRFDAVTLEVIWTRLVSVVDEAAAALVRSSFSTLVRESYDFSCIITDPKGRCLGQATDSIPSFIGTLPKTVRHFLDHFPAETLNPGDVLITNDPWMGTGHLPDLTVVKPIFLNGKLTGFAASTTHSPDMGGRTGTSDIRDVFEEGFQVPMLKLIDAGKVDQTFIALLRKNVRVPDQVVGDLWAQVSALELMEKRLFALMDDYQLTELVSLADEILDRSEAAMRDAIRRFPDGEYDYELNTDGVVEPLTIRIKVKVQGDSVLVDYDGTSPQVDRAVNVALCYTYAQTVYGLKCILAPDMPNNDGALRPIEVVAPEGSILNHRYPASGQTRTLTGHFLPFAVFGALAKADPTRVAAGPGSPLWSLQATGVTPTGETYVNKFFFNGGTGGTDQRDGYNVLSWPSNISCVPVEMMEQQSNFRVQHKRFRIGSGGEGRHRGGLGQETLLEYRSDLPVVVGFHAERTVVPPPGIAGGDHGQPGVLEINDRALTPNEQKVQHVIRKGDRIHMRTPGGAGFGTAAERDPAAVEADRAAGYI